MSGIELFVFHRPVPPPDLLEDAPRAFLRPLARPVQDAVPAPFRQGEQLHDVHVSVRDGKGIFQRGPFFAERRLVELFAQYPAVASSVCGSLASAPWPVDVAARVFPLACPQPAEVPPAGPRPNHVRFIVSHKEPSSNQAIPFYKAYTCV